MSSTSIIAYLILSLSIGYAFIYPAVGDLSELMAEKQKYDQSLEKVRDIENKKAELLTQFNKISDEDKKEVNTILPNSFDFVNLAYQIDAVASSHGISVENISSNEVDRGSAFDELPGEESSLITYESATIDFSFKASYEKFGAFMDDLEKSLRILDVRSIKITAEEGVIYSYDVQFETYWLKTI